MKRLEIEATQAVLHTDGALCGSAAELLEGGIFAEVVGRYLDELVSSDSPLLDPLPVGAGDAAGRARILDVLRGLADRPLAEVAPDLPIAGLAAFVEGLYDYWRAFDRFMVVHGPARPCEGEPGKPHREFNAAVEHLHYLIRGLYRDIEENITGQHPGVYRQVSAGVDVGIWALPVSWDVPAHYRESLGAVPMVRQILINPPLILDPPCNTRTGRFARVDEDPLASLVLDPDRWLCYPAQVGELLVLVYVHQSFMGLGCALANLFELASDERIAAGPDALYVYGAPLEKLARFGESPTVFFEDRSRCLVVGAVPAESRFGYFGYLKKMVLTLHNVVMMRRGRMPFHGALADVELKDGRSASVLLIGDTATGKSETLEALRVLGTDVIRRVTIVADDMGSIEVSGDGRLIGYGTETGAFIRLDDLQKGYAWGQVDRAIIMSPQKVNARVVLPVTTLAEVLDGHRVDLMLYANNYEQVDEAHPAVERFDTAGRALAVFSEGAAMAKGTTSERGLTHAYFGNVFGPAQYPELHDELARRTFDAAFASGVFVGQLRTRLAIPGCETEGPAEAARALVRLIGTSADSIIVQST